MIPKQTPHSAETYPAYARATEPRLPVETAPIISLLVRTALDTVEIKYGPASPNPRAYHNSEHTTDVLNAVSQLADVAVSKHMLRPKDKNLLLIAAAYHDIEQDLGNGTNERASARLAIKHMNELGSFSEEDRQLVRTAIMGTETYIDDTGLMRQSARSNNYAACLLADADLAILGQPTELYQLAAVNLFRELYPREPLGGKSYNQFVAGQPDFIAGHTFYTPEANELFPCKSANQATAFPEVSAFIK